MTFRGHRVEAWVGLASQDGHRLMLEFHGILGIYVFTMPVVWHDGTFHDLIADEAVVIEKWVDHAAVGFGLTLLRFLLEKTSRESAA